VKKNKFRKLLVHDLVDKSMREVLDHNLPVWEVKMNWDNFCEILKEDYSLPEEERDFDYSIWGADIKIDNRLAAESFVCDTAPLFRRELENLIKKKVRIKK